MFLFGFILGIVFIAIVRSLFSKSTKDFVPVNEVEINILGIPVRIKVRIPKELMKAFLNLLMSLRDAMKKMVKEFEEEEPWKHDDYDEEKDY